MSVDDDFDDPGGPLVVIGDPGYLDVVLAAFRVGQLDLDEALELERIHLAVKAALVAANSNERRPT